MVKISDIPLCFSNLILSSLIMQTNLIDFKSSSQVRAYWQPPNYVFGIVWPILYLLFGIINIRVFSNKNIIRNSLKESIVQNLWVIVTGVDLISLGLVTNSNVIATQTIQYIVGLFLLLYLNYMTSNIRTVELNNQDELSYLLYIPYSIWIKFALILNLQIVHKLTFNA